MPEEKHEENEEVLGAPGTGQFIGGKDVRVIEDEGEVRRLMSNFDAKNMDMVLKCIGRRGKIFQGLNHMNLVGCLIQLEGGGQLSIFWPPQALRLVQ